jgi:hypothetical protein
MPSARSIRAAIRPVGVAVVIALVLAGCSVGGSPETPTATGPSASPTSGPSSAASASPVAASPSGAAGSPGLTASPGASLGQAALRLRLLSTFGSLWYCDPDLYPVARADPTQLAMERFSEVRGDAAWSAIAGYLGLDPTASTFPPEQQVAAYDLWKQIRAIQLDPTADGWAFDQVFAPKDGGTTGERVSGTIAPDGAITITSRAPSGMPNCPICLVRGTRIATPDGSVPVEEIRAGMVVLTLGRDGHPMPARVSRVGSTLVPTSHLVVHLVLADGRSVTASPGHPLPDGRRIGSLTPGDPVEGSWVLSATLEPYAGGATFDLLPAGPTGTYLADGIWLGSTLATGSATPTGGATTTGERPTGERPTAR